MANFDINVGVVGVGLMGQNHARIYSEIANLVGVSDLDKDVGKSVAKKYNAVYYENLDDLLKKVDAITVATPTFTHHEIAKKAIDAGRHILVEKPICEIVPNAEELCASVQDQDIILATGHVERYNPVVSFVKNKLKKGEYGDILSMSATRVSPLVSRVKDVGAILDLGVHEIDIGRYLTNSEVRSVYALAQNNGKKFENRANLLLEFDNGCSENIEVNWLTEGSRVRTLNLTCKKKSVEVDYFRRKIRITSSQLVDYNESDLSTPPWSHEIQEIYAKLDVEPLKFELEDFLSSIKEKRQPLVTGHDGLQALKIAQAAIESYKNKKIIYLN